MHFVPGVVEYPERTVDPTNPYRVYVSEDMIRKMNPTMAGKPMYVVHPEDEVPNSLDEVKKDADGWVIESFFNPADGKTWAKFIVVSEEALQKIKYGWALSNSYFFELDNQPDEWNAVPYIGSVVDGEHEHLAIVETPRYAESKILTPEDFKKYNEEKMSELERLSNSKKDKGDLSMKLNIFKRTKVENSFDIEGHEVELPLTKKIVSLSKAVNEYDKMLNMHGYANGDHLVKVGEKDEMSVNDLSKKYMEACNAMEEMKAKHAASMEGGEPGMDDNDPAAENEQVELESPDASDVGDRGGDVSLDNEEDEEGKEESKKDKAKNAALIAKAKAILAKEKAARLSNANTKVSHIETARVAIPQDQLARGRARYGSVK